MSPIAPFAESESMLSDVTMGVLSNVIVTPATGDAFPAMFDVADRQAFDAATVGDYRLRYQTVAAVLEKGDTITIDSAEYLVLTHPERINGHESAVELARES